MMLLVLFRCKTKNAVYLLRLFCLLVNPCYLSQTNTTRVRSLSRYKTEEMVASAQQGSSCPLWVQTFEDPLRSYWNANWPESTSLMLRHFLSARRLRSEWIHSNQAGWCLVADLTRVSCELSVREFLICSPV